MALHTNPLIEKQIVLTPSAVKRILEVLKIKQPKMFLRLKVASGGCYGFSYIFEFDSNLEANDIITLSPEDKESVIFAISQKFLKYINEATVDYIDELGASYFTVLNNQNASGGCGCGNSFSVKEDE
jgi:iron-sulfur cluster assembly accessory protein